MIISMSLPTDLKRDYSYWSNAEGEQEPAMFLYREGQFGRSACIALSSAWLYDEPHKKSRSQQGETVGICLGMMEHLGIPIDQGTAHKFLMFIQDGLDRLVKMPPAPEHKRVAGEVEMQINGQRMSTDILA